MVMLTTRLHHPDHDDHNQADQFLSTEPELPGCINCFCSGANLQKYQIIKVAHNQIMKVAHPQLMKIAHHQIIKVAHHQIMKVAHHQIIKDAHHQIKNVANHQLKKHQTRKRC